MSTLIFLARVTELLAFGRSKALGYGKKIVVEKAHGFLKDELNMGFPYAVICNPIEVLIASLFDKYDLG